MKINFKNVINNIPPQHVGKIIGTSIGLLFGLLVLIFGFWRVLLLGLFIACGLFVGHIFDSNPDIKDRIIGFFDRLFRRNDRYF